METIAYSVYNILRGLHRACVGLPPHLPLFMHLPRLSSGVSLEDRLILRLYYPIAWLEEPFPRLHGLSPPVLDKIQYPNWSTWAKLTC